MSLSKEDQLFNSRISRLDLGLFNKIYSQTSEDDKKSLLAVQGVIREFKNPYVYLEIGSHLGGSIQPYLLDSKCARIYSIDKRPALQPDERSAEGFVYPDNSTARMLDNLKPVSEDIQKIVCFDNDAAEIDRTKIELKPDICFIDGEHTNRKVISDFEFCNSIRIEDGIIIFHDISVIKNGLAEIVNRLRNNKVNFKFLTLKSNIAALFFGESILLFKKIKSKNIVFGFRDKLARDIIEPLKERIKVCLFFLKLRKIA